MLQMWGPCINRDGIVLQSCANLSGFRIKVRKDSLFRLYIYTTIAVYDFPASNSQYFFAVYRALAFDESEFRGREGNIKKLIYWEIFFENRLSLENNNVVYLTSFINT